ncbi:MaoC family dehydratase [Sinorhizobium sp. BG8]|uniref:MaoC family dehydratase n=1 Tax=Sinorhizobium sp. BG8 TaxID=2613773 RepID=UPI00193DDE5F|nr:MaoC family dehydratase [Sinorhizobium sp. BG8]QRM56286.1 MaoC family dehydratase [Sinorhizobium sp. BG8]
MTEPQLTFEDFPPGRRFDFQPRHVTTEEIVAFAREFDPQPMHVDEAAGKASILGGLSASGWHTSAMMMRMLCDSYINRTAAEGSPGVDRMEWKRPVLAGDTLTGHCTVLEARRSRSRPEIGIATFRAELSNQRGETVAICDYANMIRVANVGGDADAHG